MVFGSGNDQCSGPPPARQELRVGRGTLYERNPDPQWATELDSVPFQHDGSVYGVSEMPVTW